MVGEITQTIESYFNYLRDLSYTHSDERREFAKTKLIAHRGYMEGYRKTTPFLHPDTWQDERTAQ